MSTPKGKLAICGLLSLFISFSAPAAVLYVNVNSSNPVAPYADWGTAAADIQSAVNAANPGDEVLVTNGVYQTGQSSMSGSNRVTVLTPILLQSVNGPAATVIRGYQVPGTTNGASSIRCVYLGAGAVLSGFTLTNGSCSQSGGGGVLCQKTNSSVFNCLIAGNASSSSGGGGNQGNYNNCSIVGNTSGFIGGGVANGSLTNCLVTANIAPNGGGVYNPPAMVNCTVVSNAAVIYSGGASYGGGVYVDSGFFVIQFRNCIIYFNEASHINSSTVGINVYNFSSYTASNCCSPDFTNSTCNTNLPGLVDVTRGNYHLQIGSPCIDTGDNASASAGLDLDGNPRVVNGTVDIGAYENQFTGIAHYVSLISKIPVAPYTNWLTAATNIQDAIDAANAGEIVVVSNGVYQTGGRVVYDAQTNRVAINKPITVTSLNGPIITAIVGNPVNTASAVRCAYLTNNATLIGFTLSNGWALLTGDTHQDRSGGGLWCESTNALLYNCILSHNSAYLGSGAYSGTLSNCSIINNNQGNCFYGGGAAFSVLVNCLITNNVAWVGGGVMGGFLNGCTVEGNFSSLRGGGTCSNIVINSMILNNKATQGGGGAYMSSLTNCIVAGNVSTNGRGGGAIYGVLTGCTVTNNKADMGGGACSNLLITCFVGGNIALTNGGGTFSCIVSNCTLAGNQASGGGGFLQGGGACFGTLYDCLIVSNSAVHGGGAASNILYNCTLFENSAVYGSGSFSSILNSCLVESNTGSYEGGGCQYGVLNACILDGNQADLGGGAYGANLNNCLILNNTVSGPANNAIATDFCNLTNCTISGNSAFQPDFTVVVVNGTGNCVNCIIYDNPYANSLAFSTSQFYNCCVPQLPVNGSGNFTNTPIFLDLYHLASNSPGIDAGLTSAAVGSMDIDGRPRIVNGAVDVGASEFQGAGVEPFIVWLAQYGLPDDGSVDFVDLDGTGMNNWQKWIAGLNPTNPASVLQMAAVTNSVAGATVTWQSVTGITYFVQSSTNLGGAPAFSSIQSNIVGQAGVTSYMDVTATNGGPYFYRVGVQ